MTAKQHGKLIRKAAKSIYNDVFVGACIAIFYEYYPKNRSSYSEFIQMFKPSVKERCKYKVSVKYWLDDGDHASTKSHRIICLLFFAEMVEDGTIKIKP